ncbi:MAG: Peptidase family, partial [Acidobacteria bacterium]|nr:Peptidase family [Acidobacteriota bacterium]
VVGYDALGSPSLMLLALFLALITTTASPYLARGGRGLAVVAGTGAIVLTIVALLLPPYTKESPRRLSLIHQTVAGGQTVEGRQTLEGKSLWLTETLTPPLRGAAPFDPKPREQYPWYRGGWSFYAAPAPAIAVAPVEARVVSDVRTPKRTLTIDLVSRRNAPRVGLVWKTKATVDAIRINGVTPPPAPPRFRNGLAPGWHQVLVRGSSAHIEIVMREVAPIEAVAMDATFGLPPAGLPLTRARDASPAVASQEGDQTTTRRAYRW